MKHTLDTADTDELATYLTAPTPRPTVPFVRLKAPEPILHNKPPEGCGSAGFSGVNVKLLSAESYREIIYHAFIELFYILFRTVMAMDKVKTIFDRKPVCK